MSKSNFCKFGVLLIFLLIQCKNENPFSAENVNPDDNPTTNQNTDAGKKSISIRYSVKLREYRRLLLLAKEKGYQIVSVIDWFKNYESLKNEKIVIMRHDVDWNPAPQTAMKMGLIENQLKIKSTYYFRWITADAEPIEYLKKLGHEIGLHYETLATYCKIKKINKKEDVTPEIINVCREILKAEISQFEWKYGDIESICSHGDDWNRNVGIPNFVLMLGEKMQDYSIITYANSQEVRYTPKIFVADSGNKWDPISFEQALNEEHQSIYVLIHPDWWQ